MIIMSKNRLIRFITLLIIAIFVSTTLRVELVYSGLEKDNSSRHEYGNESTVFSPGYLNVTKYKTDYILRQTLKKKTFMESVMEYVRNKLSNKVATASTDKVAPELKKKTSAVGEASESLKNASLNLGAADQTLRPEGTLVEGKTETQDGKILAETYLHNGVETRYVYVSKDSGYVNNSISSGIRTARSGDIIFVKNGTYGETISLTGVSGIQIMGENTANTIFDTSYGSNSMSFFKSSDITIKNFTFIGNDNIYRNSQYYSGLSFSTCSNISIENNIIKNMGGYGIAVAYGAGDINILNNTITGCGAGIWGNDSSLVIKNNVISDTIKRAGPMGALYNGQAIQVFGTKANTEIIGNVIHDNEGKSISISSGFYFRGDAPTPPTPEAYTGNYVYNNNLKGGGADYAIGTSNYAYSPSTNVSTLSTPSLLQVQNNPEIESFIKADFSRDTLYKDTGATILDSALKTAKSEDRTDLFGQAAIDLILGALMLKSREDTLDADRANRLAEILKNPTEDEKVVIKTLAEVLAMVKTTEGEANEGLLKTVQAFIDAMINLLLSQAMPDLLKEGDIANIRNIMTDLGSAKNDILADYENNTKPYYEEAKKLIAHELSLLKHKDIISKTLTKAELEKMPRSELDKIIKKLKDSKDKALDQVIEKELSLRKQYLEPNNIILQDKMKVILTDFTKRITSALEGGNK